MLFFSNLSKYEAAQLLIIDDINKLFLNSKLVYKNDFWRSCDT